MIAQTAPSVVETITRAILLGTGTFAAAMLFYLAYVRSLSLVRYKHPYDLAYLLFDVGVAITKLVIDSLVYGSDRIQLSWIVVAYTSGETMIFIGVLGVVLYHRRVQRERLEIKNGTVHRVPGSGEEA
jgi:hypothetical protein